MLPDMRGSPDSLDCNCELAPALETGAKAACPAMKGKRPTKQMVTS